MENKETEISFVNKAGIVLFLFVLIFSTYDFFKDVLSSLKEPIGWKKLGGFTQDNILKMLIKYSILIFSMYLISIE